MTTAHLGVRHTGSMQLHVVADQTERDGGFVLERLVEHGAIPTFLDRDDLPTFPVDTPPDLVLLLGSQRSAHDPRHGDVVAHESAYVLAALASGVPIAAICYGAQLAARALGGTSYRADDPEIGWRRVDTEDPVLCPEGPWGQFHQDVAAPPPTSRVLGTSWAGPQCFVDDSLGGRLIAWQFHPEVTPQTFERWVRENESLVRSTGASPDDLVREGQERAAAYRNRAHALTDAALSYLRVDTKTHA